MLWVHAMRMPMSMMGVSSPRVSVAVEERAPLLAPVVVLAVDALAVVGAQDVGLETLAVLLQAPRLAAVAPLVVLPG